MKTLILNGSPRKNGDTVSLIHEVTNNLKGSYRQVNAYYCNIKPCVDCRYCVKNNGCCVDDEMQEVYDYIQECDNILVASPIYMSELTGPLLSVTSRLQPYYCAKYFRKEIPIMKPKKGAVLLVGGGDGDIELPHRMANRLLYKMNAKDVFPLISSYNTDKNPAIHDKAAVSGAKDIADFFNT
jgi:multimeric flavodoxin WrbA